MRSLVGNVFRNYFLGVRVKHTVCPCPGCVYPGCVCPVCALSGLCLSRLCPSTYASLVAHGSIQQKKLFYFLEQKLMNKRCGIKSFEAEVLICPSQITKNHKTLQNHIKYNKTTKKMSSLPPFICKYCQGNYGNSLMESSIFVVVTTPTTTQHNLNTVAGLDMKMTVQTPPPPHHTNSTIASRSLRLTFIEQN